MNIGTEFQNRDHEGGITDDMLTDLCLAIGALECMNAHIEGTDTVVIERHAPGDRSGVAKLARTGGRLRLQEYQGNPGLGRCLDLAGYSQV